MDIKDIIKKIPKIDLHCHIDGSVRPETILDIAIKEGIPVPTNNIDEFYKFVQVSKECTSLKEYLSKFDYTLKVMQKPQYLYRITKELLEDCKNQNVKYTELRCSPYFFMNQGADFHQVISSILDAMKFGEENYGVHSKLIIICMRNHSVDINKEIVEKSRDFLGKGIVAIDLAGSEAEYAPEIQEEVFKLAKDYGFNITIHAGEVNEPKNIITSVEKLFAERIGHGVNAIHDEKVLDFIIDKQIPLEICPTSNVQTHAVESLESHPIKRFLDKGVKVTLNTDNTTVSNTTITKEYELLVDTFNLSIEEVKKIIINGVEAAFLDKKEKETLIEVYNKSFKELNI